MALASCNQPAKQTNSKDAADAIYYGGNIITMEGDSANYAEAVVVKDGKIVFVGGKDEAMKVAGDGRSIIDLQGNTVLPGFIDPHVHPSIAAPILPAEIVSAVEWNIPDGKSIAVKDHASYPT